MVNRNEAMGWIDVRSFDVVLAVGVVAGASVASRFGVIQRDAQWSLHFRDGISIVVDEIIVVQLGVAQKGDWRIHGRWGRKTVVPKKIAPRRI